MHYVELMGFLREYKTFLIVVLGAVITVIGALWDNKEKLNDKQEALELERTRNDQYVSIIHRSDQMLTKQQSVIESSQQIIDLQNKLKEANESIITLQNSTIDHLTGGDSKPYIQIIVAPKDDYYGQTLFFVSNPGRFTIHSMSFDINDFNDNIKTVVSQSGTQKNYSVQSESKTKDLPQNKLITMGELPVTFDSKVYEGTFPKEMQYVNYTFHVKWLNGYFTGSFDLKKENDTYKVTRLTAWDRPNHELDAKSYYKVDIHIGK
jgi:hypothetical protein